MNAVLDLTNDDILDVIADSKSRALAEPKWFLKTILRQKDSDPWQIDGLEAVADVFRFNRGEPTRVNHQGHNRITVRSCHGPGKTHWLAQIIHWWNYCHYGLVVGTAPKQQQLITRLMPRYRKILRHAVPGYSSMMSVGVLRVKMYGETSQGVPGFDEDWGFIGETATDPDNMSGYHDEPQLFIIDEASAKVLDGMFPVIEGTLTTAGSVLVMIGNPTRTQGEFYDSHNKAKTMGLYYKMHIKPDDSQRIDKKWMSIMLRKYGEDSPVYKVRCLGEFAEMEENQLIALSWLYQAREREFVSDGSLPKLRVSVDVSDGGEDETVITVAYIYHTFTLLVKQYAFSFLPAIAIIETARAARRIYDQYHNQEGRLYSDEDDLVVDSIGVGAGTAGALIDWGYPVILYKGGESSDDKEQWRNRRVQSYLVMRDRYAESKIIIADDFVEDDLDWDEFCAQNCSVHNKPGTERIEDLETKEQMKARGVKSPDRADSPAMIFATQQPIIGKQMSVPVAVAPMDSAHQEMW